MHGPLWAESDMAESAVPTNPSKPHGLDWRPVVNDYRAKAGRSDAPEIDGASPVVTGPQSATDANEDAMVAPINLRKFQEQLDRDRLDEIAALVLALTYCEMIELANAIWKAQPEGSAITQDNLAALLHRWSKSHPAVLDGGDAHSVKNAEA
jgi:hypothetical protein